MATALSNDLRKRVLAAVDGGMSCRQAAQHFGVSAASAIRWNDRRRREGQFGPKALGGDRRSGRIKAHGKLILSLVEEAPDITLGELRTRLAEQGTGVAISTIWRFFKRHTLRIAELRPSPALTIMTSAKEAPLLAGRKRDADQTKLQIRDLENEVLRRFMEWHHLPIRDVAIPDAGFERAWPANAARLQGRWFGKGLGARGLHMPDACQGALAEGQFMGAASIRVQGLRFQVLQQAHLPARAVSNHVAS